MTWKVSLPSAPIFIAFTSALININHITSIKRTDTGAAIWAGTDRVMFVSDDDGTPGSAFEAVKQMIIEAYKT